MKHSACLQTTGDVSDLSCEVLITPKDSKRDTLFIVISVSMWVVEYVLNSLGYTWELGLLGLDIHLYSVFFTIWMLD